MNTSAEYMKAVTATTSGTATSDFFTLDLNAWTPEGTDPAGSNMTIIGRVYINAFDSTSGLFAYYLVWFTFKRYLGVITSSIDQAFGTVTANGSVVSTTAKITVTGATIGHTVNYSGLVFYAGHY